MKSLEMYTQAGTSPAGRASGAPAVKGRAMWPSMARANTFAAHCGPLETPI